MVPNLSDSQKHSQAHRTSSSACVTEGLRSSLEFSAQGELWPQIQWVEYGVIINQAQEIRTSIDSSSEEEPEEGDRRELSELSVKVSWIISS